jgi:hypothetical protein
MDVLFKWEGEWSFDSPNWDKHEDLRDKLEVTDD